MAHLPYKRIRKHKFNGKTYRMIWKKPPKTEGSCDDPETSPDKRNMFINPNATDEEFMDCLIHESLHAEQWYLDEETVLRISHNLSDLLKRCNYRMLDNEGNIVHHLKGQGPDYVKT